MIFGEEFNKIDLRAGTIVKSELLKGARKPALKLWIDFGPNWGIKKSSAQVTKHYSSENVIRKQVVCVTNFPTKQIPNFLSEIPVTDFSDKNSDVFLARLTRLFLTALNYFK